jgi:hypothetical protein
VVTIHGREIKIMVQKDPNKFTFEFDENGTNEVSAQIMDSYNSGVIDQEMGKISTEVYQNNEE